MLTYDLIVIGFGKAGKTLAAKLASAGKKVALIERSKAMYGGTCINIGCIPTKTLLVAAEKDFCTNLLRKIVLGTECSNKYFLSEANRKKIVYMI